MRKAVPHPAPVESAHTAHVEPEPLLFELPGNGFALFTNRADGNMSSVTGLDAENGDRARVCVRARHGLTALVRSHQVHGSTVLRIAGPSDLAPHVPPPPRPSLNADGHATSLPMVGLMVLTADCLPIVLAGEHGVAVVHAGWRGLAAGVIEEGARVLRELDAGPIAAIVGPGAGACCYEVGDQVHAVFDGAHRSGRHIDLKAIARDRLLAAGVADVRDVGICTICDERFFSHRREASSAGRQAGIAWSSGSR